ncbi:hypothetical protein [Bradyrhizobium sp. 141]|uniref:hypothetical protein n=1 Tax=Bradyrhizobium sp. 141 TaxID=2782617 RepID=UPI001FFA0971|nr:hypothetical protein [Bradyrhizobium sp. 141]MCK1721880.1 hypothetical protein [Bradyrhizobium sp. 141]
MKPNNERPYATPEAAARKLVKLAKSVEPINGRIHIEKINYPFISKDGCSCSSPEFGAGVKYVVEKGWLDLHESGTYVKLLTPGEELLTS